MQNVISFFMDHQAVIISLLVAILDFLIALNPSMEGNGILHQIYVYLKSKKNQELPKS